MWKVVYVAPSQKVATRLKEELVQNGLIVSLRAVGEEGPVEMLVPPSEAIEAIEIINKTLCR
ncbi:MAG: glutamate decarboxylase [Bacillota bacterium]|nr:glutamate decarboxylase [Bacillota bacterium]